jgi:hypothetical protein
MQNHLHSEKKFNIFTYSVHIIQHHRVKRQKFHIHEYNHVASIEIIPQCLPPIPPLHIHVNSRVVVSGRGFPHHLAESSPTFPSARREKCIASGRSSETATRTHAISDRRGCSINAFGSSMMLAP